MKPRLILTMLLTASCWFAISLLSLGGDLEALWDHLGQAARFDEEFMIFSCFLLFSVAFAVHIVAIGWRVSYRRRFLLPELGILYSVSVLILGNILRQPLRNPVEAWFQIIYPIVVVGVFVFIFGRPYAHILRHDDRGEPNAAPNGGPATQPGNSAVTEGPPSVS